MSENKAILHLPGLNGLRAFAALAVVFSHLRLAHPQFGFEATTSLQLASYGVTIFFALSGFLITFLLLKEKDVTASIDIKSFYVRRVLRIWPLYYFYLGLSLATVWLTQPELLPGNLFFYVFMMANVPFIMNHTLPRVDHFWSLGVEEQFYLFWPVLMKKLKNPMKFIIGLIGFFMIGKAITGFLKAKYNMEIPYLIFTVNRFDCMAIGALGAFIVHHKKERILNFCQSKKIQALTWVSFALLTVNAFKIHPLINHSFIAMVTVFAIFNVSFNKKSAIKLDKPILDFLGKISFGIYVYHPLIIFGIAKAMPVFFPSMGKFGIYSIVVSGTILAAYLSYRFLEKPFLRIKDRFAVVPSSGSKEQSEAA